MNDTCDIRNIKKALSSENYKIQERFISYFKYGQLFEFVHIIFKEKDILIEIMNNLFGNSALIYYKLKSKIIEGINEKLIIKLYHNSSKMKKEI